MTPSSFVPDPIDQAEPVAEGHVPLSRVPVGWRRTVVSVEGTGRAELEREGVLPGCVVVVTARTPLGGPLVIELGRARLALSADVAAQVATTAFSPAVEPG